MLLKPLTNGSVAGTGTIVIESGMMGAVLISADGTNAAVVKLYKDNSSGPIVYQVSTKAPLFTAGPINVGSQALYYDISGTSGAAQIYEWIE